MKKSRVFLTTLGLGTALLSGAYTSQAGPTWLNFDTGATLLAGRPVAVDTGSVLDPNNLNNYITGTFDYETAVGYFIGVDGATAPPGPNTPISPLYKNYGNGMIVFCADLDFYLDGGVPNSLPKYWEAKNLPPDNSIPAIKGSPIWEKAGIYKAAYLYNKYVADVIAAAGGTDDNAKAAKGGGLQMAIWEVLYEGRNPTAYNVTANQGDFYMYPNTNDGATEQARAASAIAQANAWLAASQGALSAITENSFPYNEVWWDPMDYSPNTKDFMHDYYRQSLIGGAIPEPAEIALLIAAALGIGMGYRRMKK